MNSQKLLEDNANEKNAKEDNAKEDNANEDNANEDNSGEDKLGDSSGEKRRHQMKGLWRLGFTALCLSVAFAGFMTYEYTHHDAQRRVWLSVNQYLFLSDSYEPCTDDMTLTQSFTADMPFDEIYLQAENQNGEANDSVYLIELLNEKNNLIATTRLSGNQVISYGLTKLDIRSDADHGEYRLSIRKLSGHDTLSFLYYDTGNYDAYPGGELTGLKNGKKPDLCLIVLKVLAQSPDNSASS